jgi:hypothetical protein
MTTFRKLPTNRPRKDAARAKGTSDWKASVMEKT